MKKILMVIIMITLLVGCTTTKEKNNKTDSVLFKEEYEKLNGEKTNYGDYYYRELEIKKDNPIIYKDASDIIDMIKNKDTFVVYFGFSTCPWCRSVITNLLDVASDLEIKTIYYVDVKEIRDTLEINEDGNIVTSKEGTKDYYKLLEKFEDVLEDYTLTNKDGEEVNSDEKRIYAPNIVSVIDGVATKMTTGISDMQKDAFMELTDDINTDSYDMIKCTIECIVEKKEICEIDKKC